MLMHLDRWLPPNSEIGISNARRIINTRNKIAHGYDEIENAEIWNIIIIRLSKLKTEVGAFLGRF